MMTGPPELPELQINSRNSSQVQLSFVTFTNCTYQVETATNLMSVWSSYGAPIAGDGNPKTLDFAPGSPEQFFRVGVQY
jgi:hypothetical protein